MTMLFTSDPHFFHKKMVLHRGYEDSEQMNDDIIKTWNRGVSPKDTIFIIGDFSFGSAENTSLVLEKLNGIKILIKGNHDHDKVLGKIGHHFHTIKDRFRLKIEVDGQLKLVILDHFPLMTWEGSHFGSWHLHGHCHGNLKADETTRMDVGWDVFKRPITLREVIDIMKTRTYIRMDARYDDKPQIQGE